MKNNKNQTQPIDIGKSIRLPRRNNNEIFGVVITELGGARMQCVCEDGKERICRIPGRLKRRIWVKEGDIVIIKPWDVEGDKKGDVIWRYRKLEVSWLRKHKKLEFY